MIYTPKHFKVERPELAHQIIQRYNFATLISFQEDTPIMSHLPFLFEPQVGRDGLLLAHMARANPQWRTFRVQAEVTVIFQGPHAYVSPRWYTPQADNVPTWNYAAVHVHGIPRVISDEVSANAVMKRLVEHHDPNWTLALPDQDQKELLREIVVFAIDVTKVDAKFKLSQNRSQSDQAEVASALAKGSTDNEREFSEAKSIVDATSREHGHPQI
ncbi:MAG: FMN-binding negative transcriptional regulator [Proteobacteria bacterium]|nr:FMN-binding negative transcriptional regulator [Pseudomonadota bacterium]